MGVSPILEQRDGLLDEGVEYARSLGLDRIPVRVLAMSFVDCKWLNPPAHWTCDEKILRVTTDHATDFWRETHYGFTRDNGHFFARTTTGDFTAQLRIRARYEALYDQAGLMVRVDEANWIKAGIEMSDGEPLLGSVLTVGRSDWATGHYTGDPADFWLRVTVRDGVIRLQFSENAKSWPLMRLAPFPRAALYSVGPMCCTPERSGLQIEFSGFEVMPAVSKGLHDLS